MEQQLNNILQQITDTLNKVKPDMVTLKSLQDNIHALSVSVVLGARTDEEKKAIDERTKNMKSPEELGKVLLEYITPEQYEQIYGRVALKVMESYITFMKPSVPEDVQIELDEILTKIQALKPSDK